MVGILGANSVSGGYEVDNSLRFDKGSSAHLSRTLADSNEKIWTYSTWIKNCIGAVEPVLLRISPNDDTIDNIVISTSGNLQYQVRRAPNNHAYLNTNQKLRDPSAWYHIVVAVDTTQSTNTNRIKFYINGNQVTSFANAIYPDQNFAGAINGNSAHVISEMREDGGDGTRYSDMYLAETHFIDGVAAQTDFGEFDDNGVWIPKAYTGSYGTNGFYLEYKETGTDADASGMGADTSGEDNHFTSAGLAATDVTTDTPTNNFCTMNPLTQSEVGNSPTFAEGNLKITMTNFDEESVMATMGVTKGKWYWEVKGGWTTSNWGFGIEKSSSSNTGFLVGYTDTSYSFSQAGYKQGAGGSASQIDSGLGNTDIIGYALDLDNGHFNFSQNGVWYNGSATESTTFNTSTHDFTSLDFGDEFAMPTIAGFGDGAITTEINFGNPSFAISSSNADGRGYGNFEYAPPSGYYSLCTKNLAEFG